MCAKKKIYIENIENNDIRRKYILCTYSTALYPWHTDTAPITFAGRAIAFSPIYFVTKLPPKLNPTHTIFVDGYRFNKFVTISEKSPV